MQFVEVFALQDLYLAGEGNRALRGGVRESTEMSVDVAVKFGEARDRCTVPGQPLVGKGTRDGLDPVTGGGVTGEDRDLDLRPHAGLGVTARSDHPSPVDLCSPSPRRRPDLSNRSCRFSTLTA